MSFSSSGPISFSQINIELGKPFNSTISPSDSTVIEQLRAVTGNTTATTTSIFSFGDLKGQGYGYGTRWSWVNSNTSSNLNVLAFLSGSGKLYAGGANGTILYTTDGYSWTNQTTPSSNTEIRTLVSGAAYYGSTIYYAAGTNDTMWRSTDYGLSWGTFGGGTQRSQAQFYDLATSGTLTVAAISYNPSGNGTYPGLFYFRDTGGSPSWNTGWSGDDSVNFQTSGTRALILSVAQYTPTYPVSPARFVAVGQRGLRLTSTDGANWDVLNYGTTMSCALSYNNNGGIVLGAGGNFYTGIGQELGLYQSTDGIKFTKRFNATTTVNPVAIAGTDTRLCVLKNGGGNGTPNAYMYSISGDIINYLSGPHLFQNSSNQMHTITRSDKYWVAAGASSIQISPDPTTVGFTQQKAGAFDWWYGSASTGSTVVLAGTSGIACSTNSGVSWRFAQSVPSTSGPPYNYSAAEWRTVAWASTSNVWIATPNSNAPLFVTTSTISGATGTWLAVDLGLNSSNTSTIISSGGGINKSYYAGNKFWFAGGNGLLGQMGGDLSNPRFTNTLTNRSFNAIAHKVVNTASNLCYIYFYGENGVMARCLSSADISAAELLEPGEDLYKVTGNASLWEAVGASNTYMISSSATNFYADTYAGVNPTTHQVTVGKGSDKINRGLFLVGTGGAGNNMIVGTNGQLLTGDVIYPSYRYKSRLTTAAATTGTTLASFNAVIAAGGYSIASTGSYLVAVGNSGTILVSSNLDSPTVGYIIVGGGGAGGWATDGATPGVSSAGGGGGGGGALYGTAKINPGTTFTVTVGANGLAQAFSDGGDGGDSSVSGLGNAPGGQGGKVGQGTLAGIGGLGGFRSPHYSFGLGFGGLSSYGGDYRGGGGGGGSGSGGNASYNSSPGGGTGGSGVLGNGYSPFGYWGAGGGGGGIYSVTNATLYFGGAGTILGSGNSGNGALYGTSSTVASTSFPGFGGGGGGGGGPNLISGTSPTQAGSNGTTGTVYLFYPSYWGSAIAAEGATSSTSYMFYAQESNNYQSRVYAYTTPGTYTFTMPLTTFASTGIAFGTVPTSVTEGVASTFTVNTVNVANGVTLYWTIATGSNYLGLTATDSDFATLSGSFTITNNTGSFSITPKLDSSVEDNETFYVQIRTGSPGSGPIVATSNYVTINAQSSTVTFSPVNYFNNDSTQSSNIRAVAANGSVFVAVGDYVSYSTDNGVTWVTPFNAFSNSGTSRFQMNGVTYSPSLTMFLAVGSWIDPSGINGNRPCFAYSTDNGVTWTASYTPFNSYTNLFQFTSVAWSASDNIFAAVGTQAGANAITAWSNNGTTWSAITMGVAGIKLLSVAVNNTNNFLAVGIVNLSGIYYLYTTYSTGGKTWSTPESSGRQIANTSVGVTWVPGAAQFAIAAGTTLGRGLTATGGYNSMWTTQTWTEVNSSNNTLLGPKIIADSIGRLIILGTNANFSPWRWSWAVSVNNGGVLSAWSALSTATNIAAGAINQPGNLAVNANGDIVAVGLNGSVGLVTHAS